MKLLKTVDAEKKEIKDLQAFVELVENYEATTLEQKVIKAYAHHGSINKVVIMVNEQAQCNELIDSEYVTNLIKSKPHDKLHKMLKTNYLLKTRPTRRKKPNITK